MTLSSYLWKIAIAFSQLFNAVLGGRPNETFCSRIADRYPTPHNRAARECFIQRSQDAVEQVHYVK